MPRQWHTKDSAESQGIKGNCEESLIYNDGI